MYASVNMFPSNSGGMHSYKSKLPVLSVVHSFAYVDAMTAFFLTKMVSLLYMRMLSA